MFVFQEITNTEGRIPRMSVAKEIKTYLVVNDIKQKWLANKIGMDCDKLSQALNEKRKIDIEEFSRIIFALEVPPETFIKKEDSLVPNDA